MAGSGTMELVAGGRTLLGVAAISDDDMVALVRASTGRPGLRLEDWWVEPVDYLVGTPSTGLLARVKGVASDGDATVRWSLFVKVLQSLRHWPALHLIPADIVEEQVQRFPWRVEADLYQSALPCFMPPGLRLPRLYRVDDLGDERVALWLEDVATADVAWDLSRYRRAAYLLGRLAARRTKTQQASDAALPPAPTLRDYSASRFAGMPMLRDDTTWSHSLVAGAVDARLRADLLTLAGRLPAVLDALDRLPQALAHGDACPQNLLVPVDEPNGFVAIDFGFSGLLPVGFDLGQLLVGLSHAGRFDPSHLPALHEAIVPPYVAGLREDGMAVDEADVRYGYVGSVVVRSAIYALPVERLHDPFTPDLARLFADRARLARFLADLGLALTRQKR